MLAYGVTEEFTGKCHDMQGSAHTGRQWSGLTTTEFFLTPLMQPT